MFARHSKATSLFVDLVHDIDIVAYAHTLTIVQIDQSSDGMSEPPQHYRPTDLNHAGPMLMLDPSIPQAE